MQESSIYNFVFICRSVTFQLPANPSDRQIIMIGAGSGMAPFRSFWQAIDKGLNETCGMYGPYTCNFCATLDSDPVYHLDSVPASVYNKKLLRKAKNENAPIFLYRSFVNFLID